ncbi:MAG: hypothetical protein BMS9Abin39_0246 [Ignavibacteria bacterium]|nr:MAG: hypothetical protein BMS9Abin39_0246 [Ignavibacteria bacterium]
MKNLIINVSLKRNIGRILFYSFLVFAINHYTNIANAKGSDKNKVQTWKFQYSLTTVYDNNILKYSDKYLDRFVNNLDPGRFRINSTGDISILNSLYISRTMYLFGKVKSIPSIELRYKNYSDNSVKNFWGFGVGWRQYLTKSTSFKIRYYNIPSFYVRNYRDEDLTKVIGYTPASFRPFEFSKSDLSLWFRNYFYKRTQTTFYISYFWYKHSPDYTEYDSKNFLVGFKLRQRLTKQLNAHMGYNYVLSNANGFDEPGETKELSNDVDASFGQHIFYLGMELKMPNIFFERNSLRITGYFSKRFYSTTRSAIIDPLHSGRVDNVVNLEGIYKIYLTKYLEVAGFVVWNLRDSNTKLPFNGITVSNEKNYSQNIFGLRFRLNITMNKN